MYRQTTNTPRRPYEKEPRSSVRRAELGEYKRVPAAAERRDQNQRRTKKSRRKNHTGRNVLLCVLIGVLLLGIGAFNFVFKEYKAAENFSKKELAVSSQAPKRLIHVAVFGVDSYDEHSGRADSTMILSIDQKNGQIKLTSIQRDSYLAVEGHGNDKLTHAFAYGGAELMLRTINENFDMNITDYVVLDYRDVAEIVEILGGVELEISQAERREINRIAKEMDPDADTLEEDGLVHLNGLQATAFARIRKIDSETMRTSRQRTVIAKLLEKIKGRSVIEYPKLLQQLVAIPECSLSKTQIVSTAIKLLACDGEIRQYVIPSEEDDAIGGSYDGFWCWRYDIEAATERWHEFLSTDIPSAEEKTEDQ